MMSELTGRLQLHDVCKFVVCILFLVHELLCATDYAVCHLHHVNVFNQSMRFPLRTCHDSHPLYFVTVFKSLKHGQEEVFRIVK